MLAAPLLKRISADRLATSLLGASGGVSSERAIVSAAAPLHRPGSPAAGPVAAAAYQPTERAALQALLGGTASVPVHIVAGQLGPLVGEPGPATVRTVPAAGHHPHLTHPATIAAIMRETSGRTA